MAEGLKNGCQENKVYQKAGEKRSSSPGASGVCLSSPGELPVYFQAHCVFWKYS